MRRIWVRFLKVLVVYLLAGMVFLVFSRWPNLSGNGHVPFSGFPEFLIFAPIVPILVFDEAKSGAMGSLVAAVLYFAIVIAGFVRAMRKKSPG